MTTVQHRYDTGEPIPTTPGKIIPKSEIDSALDTILAAAGTDQDHATTVSFTSGPGGHALIVTRLTRDEHGDIAAEGRPPNLRAVEVTTEHPITFEETV